MKNNLTIRGCGEKDLNINLIDICEINSIINYISLTDQKINYFSKEIEEAINDPELYILLPNLQEGLDHCIKTREKLLNELVEVINNALCKIQHNCTT